MNLRKSLKMPVIASLSSPQFDANPFLDPSDFVPDSTALLAAARVRRPKRRIDGCRINGADVAIV
jgi:hypothetical protein